MKREVHERLEEAARTGKGVRFHPHEVKRAMLKERRELAARTGGNGDMDLSQSLALVKSMLDSKPVRISVNAVLGIDGVPDEIADFKSHEEGSVEQCKAFCDHVLEALTIVREDLGKREIQQEMDFTKPKEEREEELGEKLRGGRGKKKEAAEA